jgi:hypothetical protein
MNTAYKHLDSKLRIGDLSMGQWFGITVGLGVGLLWGFLLSPFGTYLTCASGVYLGAVPAGAAVLSGYYEISVGIVVRSALTWIRLDGRFVPGAGPDTAGYTVADSGRDEAQTVRSTLDPAALWE